VPLIFSQSQVGNILCVREKRNKKKRQKANNFFHEKLLEINSITLKLKNLSTKKIKRNRQAHL